MCVHGESMVGGGVCRCVRVCLCYIPWWALGVFLPLHLPSWQCLHQQQQHRGGGRSLLLRLVLLLLLVLLLVVLLLVLSRPHGGALTPLLLLLLFLLLPPVLSPVVTVGVRGLSVREEGWRERARPWWSVAWCLPLLLLLLLVGALLFLVVGVQTRPRHITAGVSPGEGARRPARLLSLPLSSFPRSGCSVGVSVWVCVCWARPLRVCLGVFDQRHCLYHHLPVTTC